jgi:multiple sugar transport system ATP-binding protein
MLFLLLPLTAPGIASTALLSIILCWNEAFWSLNLTAANAGPLTAFIASFSSPEGLFWAKLSAASAMAVAPILVFGWLTQKQLVRGPHLRRREIGRGPADGSTRRCEHVNKSFGDVQVIPDISLDIRDGEFVVFVGPSGCGKSTLLRLIAGLEDTSGGKILLDGVDMTEAPPAKRGLAMVFQSYALYPHMSVRDNIAFPLKMANTPKDVIAQKVEYAARTLNLADYLDRRPRALSGGQRQRVAIGRAIVREPKAFLFDEPLSNLDAALRVNMRLEITELHQQLQTTMIYVTHDQVEAMTMADRIVVLNAGNVEQFGTPLELYRTPANRFVAGFIGSPRMNFIEGADAAAHNAHAIGVRPEHFSLSRDSGALKGTVSVAEQLGSDTFLHVHVDDGSLITVRTGGEESYAHGDVVYLTPDPQRIHRFDADGKALAA